MDYEALKYLREECSNIATKLLEIRNLIEYLIETGQGLNEKYFQAILLRIPREARIATLRELLYQAWGKCGE